MKNDFFILMTTALSTSSKLCKIKDDSFLCNFTDVLQFAGELGVCTCSARPRKPSIKGGVEHLVQVRGCDEVEVGSDVGWKLLQVLLVALWEDDTLHSCPVGGQHLVLDPAHLQRTEQACLLKLDRGFTGCVCDDFDNPLAAQAPLT